MPKRESGLVFTRRLNGLCSAGGFNVLLGYLHESASHALSTKDMSDLLEDYWYRSGLSLPRSPPEAAIKARHLCPAHHHHATAHMVDVILPGKL